MDRNLKKQKQKENDKQTSSYKIFSRSVCNFAFPTDIERPAS